MRNEDLKTVPTIFSCLFRASLAQSGCQYNRSALSSYQLSTHAQLANQTGGIGTTLGSVYPLSRVDQNLLNPNCGILNA